MWHKPQLLNAIADVLLVAGSAALSVAVVLWLVRVPAVPIRQIQVQEELRHVRRGEIEMAVAGLLRGNFFSVNLDVVRQALEKLPWVRRVKVRRQWPSRLQVSIEEHHPVARWEERPGSGRNELVNAQGEVFVAVLSEKEAGRLPGMFGPPGTAPEVLGRYGEFSRLLEPLGSRLGQIRLSPRLAWQFRLEDGLLIELGREQTKAPVAARLARFVEIYPASLGNRQSRPAAIDLRYPNGFAMREGGVGRHE